MPVNRDFRDLFSAADVRFLVVGAHAVIFYSVPRYTKHLDLWIDATPENAARAWRALAAFGAPLEGITVGDLFHPGTKLQIGVEPNRIDILTDVEGLPFEEAWNRRQMSSYGDIPIALLNLDDLIASKRAAGRPQDQLDLEWLEKVKLSRRTGDP
jgi:hypothetical protein